MGQAMGKVLELVKSWARVWNISVLGLGEGIIGGFVQDL